MSDWPQEDIVKLRALWDLELSTAEIGRRMGRTKCSIVGKAHRLDLEARPDPIKRDGPRSRIHRIHRAGAITLPSFERWCAQCGGILGAEQARFCAISCDLLYLAAHRPSARKPKAPLPLPPIVAPVPAGLRGKCCFPIGEPRAKNFRFCGDPTEPGKPYCGEHWRITHVPKRAEEQVAA